MIPPVTHHRPLTNKTHSLSIASQDYTLEQLKKMGLFDDQYKLLFFPSKIPPISANGQKRWDELMDSKVQGKMTHAEYITGYAKVLSEKGIQIDSYLRGGYAAYVACIDEYFDFLIAEFLASKNLPLTKKKTIIKEHPHDVDLFDCVITEGIPLSAHITYFTEFLNQNDIKFTKRLIPKVSPLFPYQEDYVLFVVENTDRIIGKLHHPYLFARDDIRIKVQKGKLIPESAGNFWQMVFERSLKIIRTESWHEKDFRAGLAIHQFLQEDYILIEDGCSLQKIIHHAVTLGEKGIFTGAIDRAKLHCKKPHGFLVSVLIAYLHAANYRIPNDHLQILKDAIGYIPPLASLYKLALLLTCYKENTHHAEWETPDRLALYFNEHKYIFPKGFALTSTEAPFFSIANWSLKPVRSLDCNVLDGELSSLERILFELACQKPITPLTESLKQALVDHLLSEKQIDPSLFHPWIPPHNGWIQAMIKYSLKHGLILWNGLKGKMDVKLKEKVLEEIILSLAQERPNQAYAILDQEETPFRLKFLKILIENPLLSVHNNIFEELKDTTEIKVLKALDRLDISEEWFFHSKPCKERIEAYYQHSKNIKVLIKWLSLNQDLSVFLKYKNELKTYPETYIQFIRMFQQDSLAKEWINSFPLQIRKDQTLLFFTQYASTDHPLLESISDLPGLNKKELIELLHQKGLPVFIDRSQSELLGFLKETYSKEIKEDILNTLSRSPSAIQSYLKTNPPLSFISILLKNENHLPSIIRHLIASKAVKDPLFAKLWQEALDASFAKADTLHELIPFFQDRKWVHSVYGENAESKTQEWAKSVQKCTAVDDILSRNIPTYTPLVRFNHFLEHSCQVKVEEVLLKPYLELVVASHYSSAEGEKGVYYVDNLCNLFKFGLAANVYTMEDFGRLLEYKHFSVYDRNNIEFDPVLELIQTLHLPSFETQELYLEWNVKRSLMFNQRLNQPLKGENKITTDLRPSLNVLPYEIAKAASEYAMRFKLITEQYIENKVTLKEFQEEANDLLRLAPQNLKAYEDPCLICISDLTFLLTYENKRSRAYEAFNYLLQKREMSDSILDQKNYLDIRRKTENLVISKLKDIEGNKIAYSQYLGTIDEYFTSIHQKNLFKNIYLQDPILDAFELDLISTFDKIELQRSWIDILNKSDHLYDTLQCNKITENLLYQAKLVSEQEIESYIHKRTLLLKKSIKTLSKPRQKLEIENLKGLVSYYGNYKHLHQYIKNTLNIDDQPYHTLETTLNV